MNNLIAVRIFPEFWRKCLTNLGISYTVQFAATLVAPCHRVLRDLWMAHIVSAASNLG
jgi:hypothetical protein